MKSVVPCLRENTGNHRNHFFAATLTRAVSTFKVPSREFNSDRLVKKNYNLRIGELFSLSQVAGQKYCDLTQRPSELPSFRMTFGDFGHSQGLGGMTFFDSKTSRKRAGAKV